jgi:hypothetical protein
MLDAAVLLPAGLTILATSQQRSLKGTAIFLLTPVAHFLIATAYPYSALMTGVIFVFVCGMAWEAWTQFGEVAEEAPASARLATVAELRAGPKGA